METDSDFIDALTKILGAEREEVTEKVKALGVDQMMKMFDAMNAEDFDTVKQILGAAPDEDKPEETDEEDENEEVSISPLFMKSDVETDAEDEQAAKAEADGEEEMEEEIDPNFQPAIGDEVRYGGKKGIVKITKAPHDTIGLMIDGEMTMVKKGKVRPVAEGVLGMTGMMDLRRMAELAGMNPPQVTAEPVAADCAATEVAPIDEPEASVIAAPLAPGVVAGAAPAPAYTDPQAARVNAAFDDIEAVLPELRFGDVKYVRDRLARLQARLNEGAAPRARKR